MGSTKKTQPLYELIRFIKDIRAEFNADWTSGDWLSVFRSSIRAS
jgi:hypothetical protein